METNLDLRSLLKSFEKDSETLSDFGARYLNIDKTRFILKIQPHSAKSKDFAVGLDDHLSREQKILNHGDNKAFNAKDILCQGLFDVSEDTMRKGIDTNLRNIMSQNFQERLDNDAICNLQDEFLTESNDGVCNDFKLVQQNSIGSNFHFNALNGNFEELVSGPLLPGTKDFSLERSHDLPGKQKHAMEKYRSKNFRRKDGNDQGKLIEDVEKTLEKWDQILCSNTQNDEGSIFTDEVISKINMKSEAILNTINQKDMILQGQENSKPAHYNTLWNVFSEHFEEKNKVREVEKPFKSEIEFEQEIDDIGLQLKEDQKENVIADVQEEQIKLLSQFEKVLEEPSAKVKPATSKTSPTKQLTTQYEWAVQDDSDLSNFYDVLPKSRFAIQYPFELDDFQKRAVLHLENRESVFVAAHTSAGKTVVAEYAIALSKKHMTRAIYTSPIKALSNQKYRDFLTKFDSVGILTGDVTLKPEASCLIVTTEVLRSMLYKGSDTIRDIEWVIFDEVHYVNDIERGVVWEETIIMLPEHIGIIMLSATVPNAMDFANWVGQTKRRKIFVQTTYKRPTPLEHSIYINGEFKLIKSKEGEFMQNEYEKFLQKLAKAKKDQDDLREKRKTDLIEKFEENDWEFKDKKKKKFQQREQLKKEQRNFNNPSKGGKDPKLNKEQNQFYELIRHCAKENLLPCVFFAFSKKKCMDLAYGLMNLDLCTREERNKIIVFFNNSIKRLKPVDRELPQLVKLGELLKRGIAVHHGDLLPIAKEIVEILFADGLIKVLFATETFAMGVNMPAKTVIFCGLRKNDGKEFRYLKSNEYTQMSGRAGRRGLDDKGNVILFVKDKMELPPLYDLKKIIDQKGELLESKFRLTYGTIFNLLLAKEIKVVDVMQRSFSQHGKVSSLPSQQKKLKAYKKQKELIQKNLECYIEPFAKEIPIYGYTTMLDTIKKSSDELWTHPAVINNLSLPRFAIILGQNGEFDVGAIIACENINEKIIYKTFVPEYQQNRSQKKRIEISYEENYKSGLRYGDDIINGTKYHIYNLNPSHIIQIMDTEVKIPKVDKEPTYKQKEILIDLLREEKDHILRNKKENSFLSFNIGRAPNADPRILDLYRNIRNTMEKITKNVCHSCDYKSGHLDIVRRLKFLQDDIELLSQDQREDNLAFSDEFEARTRILQKMNYLDENQIALIKARVGRELGSSDIFLCEIVMENILDELPPQEVAALLSSFICQVKKSEVDNNDLVPDSLKDAIEKVQKICTNIIDLELKYNIVIEDEEEYLKEKVNFTLVKVVYEWACQKDFAEICQLTDVQEGSIVRTMLRLEILMRDLRNACKVMGNMKLHQLLEDASHLIRRDIVFAGSLYLE